MVDALYRLASRIIIPLRQLSGAVASVFSSVGPRQSCPFGNIAFRAGSLPSLRIHTDGSTDGVTDGGSLLTAIVGDVNENVVKLCVPLAAAAPPPPPPMRGV